MAVGDEGPAEATLQFHEQADGRKVARLGGGKVVLVHWDDVARVMSTAPARIGRLTLAHPGKLNAISVAMWRELREHALALDAMAPALHAVIVAGEGGAFAAGA